MARPRTRSTRAATSTASTAASRSGSSRGWLPWPDKVRLLCLLRDAGVLWLQFTGGEPLIDRDFMDAYTLAHRSGMLIEILTNGPRLHRPRSSASCATCRRTR
ncbi:hypothetical protein [Streptomyces nitrosporeus]|uniref:hypothetical protein n=1 Tax=Streptomyces nitrosporeus TaxID=28894 RepID=UPI0039A3D6BE